MQATGEGPTAGCVHPVACTACHGAEAYRPPTSVELQACTAGSHMQWSSLRVNDGQQNSSSEVMLMSGGLCLQGPMAHPSLAKPHSAPPTQQRVQPKSAEDYAAEAAPAPVVTKVRVTATATNGIEGKMTPSLMIMIRSYVLNPRFLFFRRSHQRNSAL